MAYATWPGSPWLDYGYRDALAVAEIRNGRPGFVRTVALDTLARRVYMLPERLSNAERATIEAFLKARGWTRDCFLFEDPKDAARTGVALGTAAGGQVLFALTTTATDEDYRHFPKQGSVVLYADGNAVGVASVDTDARTITAASAPGAGKVMTCDFTGLRLVRLTAPPEWRGQTVDQWGYQVELEEILREAA